MNVKIDPFTAAFEGKMGSATFFISPEEGFAPFRQIYVINNVTTNSYTHS